ncbi:MAG: glycosyltransferase [Flavipsychrobacter sp.]|nr:glycosyltransferase [Flavipsychrobacter sp.]
MNQHSPRLTVIMPAYNTALYIREAIDSILQQTFTDFEFIIINDGSKDNTLEVIKQYNDPRIRLIDQANKGLIDTLNEAILLAQSDIIARMDADDICYPERLQVEFDFLTQNPGYVLVGSQADIIDKDGNYLMPLIPIGHTHEEIKDRIDMKCPFIHPCVMFRKQAVIDAGLYPKNALTFEDHLLWKKLLNFGKVCNLPQILLKARFNPESVTIDEKWRGELFIRLRRDALSRGYVTDEDATQLKQLISSQNLSSYKNASYYAMVGKKYLWNNPDGGKAREHFAQAIKHYPRHIEPYILYIFSFVPASLRVGIYNTLKKR